MEIHDQKAYWYDDTFRNINKMDNAIAIDKLQFCTFNCRSVKTVYSIYACCKNRFIVLLQDNWFLPFDIGILNDLVVIIWLLVSLLLIYRMIY